MPEIDNSKTFNSLNICDILFKTKDGVSAADISSDTFNGQTKGLQVCTCLSNQKLFDQNQAVQKTNNKKMEFLQVCFSFNISLKCHTLQNFNVT